MTREQRPALELVEATLPVDERAAPHDGGGGGGGGVGGGGGAAVKPESGQRKQNAVGKVSGNDCIVNKGIAPSGVAAADDGNGGSVADNAEGTARERDGIVSIGIVEANLFKARTVEAIVDKAVYEPMSSTLSGISAESGV